MAIKFPISLTDLKSLLSPSTIWSIGLALLVLLLSRADLAWVAVLLVLVIELRSVMSRDLRVMARELRDRAPSLVPGVSLAVLIALSPKPGTQAVLTGLYAGWLIWLSQVKLSRREQLIVAATCQFLSLSAIFLAGAIWQWGSLAMIILSWLASFWVASYFFGARDERIGETLAAAWALIVAQSAWVFTIWLVNYVLFGSLFGGLFVVIIPQAAVVLTALGYCFAGIYVAHSDGRLSKSRLVEYLVVGLALLLVVVAGTKWNGSI